MKISVVKGKLKSIGNGTVEHKDDGSIFTYSFIEMESGEIIKRVAMKDGLASKLKEGLNSGGTELHLAPVKGKDTSLLIAIRNENDRLYAMGLDISWLSKNSWIILAVVGVLTIPIAIGLFFLIASWGSWRGIKPMLSINKYIESLPSPVLL